MGASEWREGKHDGAHRDGDGTLGEVGDGPEPTNLTVMAGGSEVEDEPGEVVRGLLEGRGSVRWVEDGVAELLSSAGGRGVAGGCGNRRRRRWWRVGGAAGESREGGRSTEGVRRARGCVASRTESRATRGRRQAGGGRGIASARHRAASVRGEEDDRKRVGWAALEELGQVSGLR